MTPKVLDSARQTGNGSATIKLAAVLVIVTIASISIGLPRTEESFVFVLVALLSTLSFVRRSLLIQLFAAHVALTFVVPTVLRWYFADVLVQLSAGPYVEALEYCTWYVAVFAIACVLASPRRGRSVIPSQVIGDIPLPMILLLLLASLAAKMLLHSLGLFRSMDIVTGSSAFTGILTAISELGLVAILLLGFKSCERRSSSVFLYVAAALLILVLSFLSGSRLALVQVVFAIALVEFRRNWVIAIVLGGVGLTVCLYLFQFILLYRDVGYDLKAAMDLWSYQGISFTRIVDDVFADRFNYVRIVQLIIEYVQFRPHLLSNYADNFIGLIPRVIWPDKPLIGLNLNEVASQMGLIAEGDTQTSIGMGVIGESYYQLKGSYGLLVAAVHGVAFSYLQRLAVGQSSILYSSYVALTIIVVVRDSFLYIVPLLCTYAAVLFAFVWLVKRSGFPAAKSVRHKRR